MEKKGITVLLITLVSIALVGCGGQTPDVPSDAVTEAEEKSEVTEEKESAEETESEAETAELGQRILYESPYGYTVQYDDTYFEVVNSEGSDCIQLKGQDLEKEVPTYVSITPTEETVEYLAEGLALQSGTDDVVVSDTVMSAKEYPSKLVYYQTEDDPRGITYQTYHVVKAGDTVYLIEIVSGDNTSSQVDNAIEEILASFEVRDMGDVEETEDYSTGYSAFTDRDRQEVETFAKSVQEDVAAKDWESMAEKIYYPVAVGDETFDNKEDFLAYDLDAAFTDAFCDAILQTDTSALFANSEGAMFGDGELWIGECYDENFEPQGLYIIAIPLGY